MILITGATGFIGRHLLTELVNQYGSNNILAMSRKPISGIQCILHDDYEDDAFDFTGCGYSSIDTVIHAGAYIPKSSISSADEELANKNIEVTSRLLASNLPNLRRLVFTSTIDVYADTHVVNEDTPLHPVTKYAKSKAICERLVQDFSISRGVTSQILRIGHVYGPGEEEFQKIIPTIMRNLLSGKSIRLVGSGSSKRSFVYVKDVANIIVQSLNLDESVGPVNVAGNDSISMLDLANMIIAISGYTSSVEYVPGSDASHRIVDTYKLNDVFSLTQTPLISGLKEEWKYMSIAQNEHSN